jgi:hypothetical protein
LLLGIALERDAYRRGEPIELRLALRNEGSQPLTVIVNPLLFDHRFLVTSEAGGSARMTPEAEHILRSLESYDASARRPVTIRPQTAYELPATAPLHQWFEVDQTGRYAVQAQRNDWRDGDAVLTSGVAHFEVR